MRFQRNEKRGSRPDGLGHPKPTRHTAMSYRAKYMSPGPNASLNRLLQANRMERREKARP